MQLSRRVVLGGGAGVLGSLLVAACGRSADAAASTFEVTRSDADWRARLTPAQYAVLRQARTERAGTSPLDAEHRPGTYYCAGCGLPVYRSDAKFDSGTGWPSFTAPITGAVGTRQERTLLGLQTEVHCRRCGGHLGHVFEDGPPPTGRRYCMNGAALTFRAA
jgi:peptide-methionine (R)-S-oxide reductase